jgi:CheY-like chemotaxis protein
MPLSKLRILIVDDYPPLRELKAIRLGRAGAVILEAGTGEEALHILATEEVDLVLIDLNLPGMSGQELRSRIRADLATSAVPMILTSVSERPQDIDASELYFQAPLDMKKLVEAIQKAVSRA